MSFSMRHSWILFNLKKPNIRSPLGDFFHKYPSGQPNAIFRIPFGRKMITFRYVSILRKPRAVELKREKPLTRT
ncbi:hypothetical protein HanRHA438_Chr08g0338831 [Helianthus annuus]|nr:hypothetical protein HanRHA438_Chr08g0338831 [Helianthus annuus]